jgi:Flp pilus assembly protein TadD
LGPLRKAATLGPNRSEAHFNLGLADERLGMLEPAKREFETALKLDPAQPDTLNMLGLVYAEERDYSQARRIWSRLSHEHPEFRPSHVNLAILSLATNRPGWSRSGELDDSSPRAEERRTLSSAASP